MTPRTLSARERQRLDTLIDRPLRTFRTAVGSMSDSDVRRLRARLEARLVGAHFMESTHGMARHLAGQEAPLLERRLAMVTSRLATPRARQLRLVEPARQGNTGTAPATLLDEGDERQAA